MLKRQLFMILLFFLVLLTVGGFQFAVVFGHENHKIITIFLTVELVVFHQLIQFHQILKMDVDALEQNEHCGPYGNKFIHPDTIKLRQFEVG